MYLDGNKDQFHQNKEVTALNETTKRLLAVATPYVLVYLEPPVGRTWSAAPVPRTRDETILLTINNYKRKKKKAYFNSAHLAPRARERGRTAET